MIITPIPSEHPTLASSSICLIRPPLQFPNTNIVSLLTPPLGLAYIAGTLKANEIEYQVLDAVGEDPDGVMKQEAQVLWTSRQISGGNHPGLLLVVGVVLTLAIMDQWVHQVQVFVRDFGQHVRHLTERQQHFLDAEQVALLSALPKGDHPVQVLYHDVESMAFYLTKGGLAHDALFARLLKGQDITSRLAGIDPLLTYYVQLNPFLPNNRGFQIGRDDRFHERLQLAIRLEQPLSASLCLRLANLSGVPATLVVGQDRLLSEAVGGYPLQEKLLPAGSREWWCVQPPAMPKVGGEAILHLRTRDPLEQLYLIGMRVGSQQRLTWPWDQPIELLYPVDTKQEESKTYRFISNSLWPVNARHEIINDSGHTVLMRLGPLP